MVDFVVGTLYSYSAYSADLQALLGYTGTQVNILSSVGDLGLYLGGIPLGLFFDKFGPRLVYVKASLFLFLGYVLMWLGAMQKIPSNNIMMGLYMFLVGYGSVSGYMAGLLTNAKNSAPEHKGKVTAVLTTAFGLSAAIFSQVYGLAFNHDVTKYFWMMALVLGILPVPAIFLVCYVKPAHITREPTSTSNLLDYRADPATDSEAYDTDSKKSPVNSLYQTSQGSDEVVTLDSGTSTLDHQISNISTQPKPVQSGIPGKYGDLRGWNVIKSPDFLLFFAIVFCCTGIGLTWINIVGNIVKSYQVTRLPASTFVIGLSVANAAGRLLFGLVTDLKFIKLPPVYLMTVPLSLILLTHFPLIWVTNYVYLFFVTLVTGLSYGGSFAVMPVVINRYFGDKNYGSNLGLLIVAVAAGSMSMGAISGALYDRQAQIQLHSGHGFKRSSTPALICHGLSCFRWTFVMTSIVSVIGIGIAIFLLRREMAYDARKARQDEFETNQ